MHQSETTSSTIARLTGPETYGCCFLGLDGVGKAISTFSNRTFGVPFRQVPILGQSFEISAVGLCKLGGPTNLNAFWQ
jgi:hypothetical protein